MLRGQLREERHEVYASEVAALVEDEERMTASAHIVRDNSAGLVNQCHGDIVAADVAMHVPATFASQLANAVNDCLPMHVEGKEVMRRHRFFCIRGKQELQARSHVVGVHVGNAEGGFQTLLQSVNQAVVLAIGTRRAFAILHGVESDYGAPVLPVDADWPPWEDVCSGLAIRACVCKVRAIPKASLHEGARWTAAIASNFSAGMAAIFLLVVVALGIVFNTVASFARAVNARREQSCGGGSLDGSVLTGASKLRLRRVCGGCGVC